MALGTGLGTGSLVDAGGAAGANNNGFFGGFFESLGGTLSRTVNELAPVWVAQQLGLQQKDQLARGNTFVVPVSQPQAVPAGVNIDTGLVLAIAAVLGIILIAR